MKFSGVRRRFIYVFQTGWIGLFKMILCYMLTFVFMIPALLCIGVLVSLLSAGRWGNAQTDIFLAPVFIVLLVTALPFSFYYAAKVLKISL